MMLRNLDSLVFFGNGILGTLMMMIKLNLYYQLRVMIFMILIIIWIMILMSLHALIILVINTLVITDKLYLIKYLTMALNIMEKN